MAHKSKAYREYSDAEIEELGMRLRAKNRAQSNSDYLPRGRLSWFELGETFAGTPQNFRKGFAKRWGKPKTKKGRSEFRAGILWWRIWEK